MKKLLTALLATALMISCAGCGNNAEMERLKKENEELKTQLNESNSDSENATESNTSSAKDDSLKQLKINEPYTVETEYGSYKITFKGIKLHAFPDYPEQDSAFLYEVENIDFKNDEYAGVDLDSSAFMIYNSDNVKMTTSYGFSYEDYICPSIVLPGKKGKFVLMLKINDSCKYLDVYFSRNDQPPLVQIQIPTTE